MPALASFWRMPDCFSRVLGMKGSAASCPIRWANSLSPLRRTVATLAAETVYFPPPFRRSRSLLVSAPTSSCPTHIASRPTAPPVHRMRKIWFIALHLHRRDLFDHEQPHELKPDCGHQQESPKAGCEELSVQLRIQRIADAEHDRGKRDHDVAGETSF